MSNTNNSSNNNSNNNSSNDFHHHNHNHHHPNNLYKRHDTPTKGRHLIATHKIQKHQLLFVERPLLSLQSITNGNAHRGVIVCRNCKCFIGGPDVSLAVASGRIETGREGVWDYYTRLYGIGDDDDDDIDIDIGNDDTIDKDKGCTSDYTATSTAGTGAGAGAGAGCNPCTPCTPCNSSAASCQEYKYKYKRGQHKNEFLEQYKMVQCRHKCGELYCSQNCEEEMWFSGGHELLCTGLIQVPEPVPKQAQAGAQVQVQVPLPESETETETGMEPDAAEPDTLKLDAHETINEQELLLQLHPLLEFKLHAVQTNEIFLMVGDLVATVVSLRRQQIEQELYKEHGNHHNTNTCTGTGTGTGTTLEDLMAPYLDFTLTPWWEVVASEASSSLPSTPSSPSSDPMIEGDDNEVVQLSQTLRELCSTSSSLLKSAFMALLPSDSNDKGANDQNNNGNDNGNYHKDKDKDKNQIFRSTLCQAIDECVDKYDMFSETFFGKIIGSFEQNALGIRARHPLCRDVIEDEGFRRRGHTDLIRCFELADMIEGGSQSNDDNDDDVNEEDDEEDENSDVNVDSGDSRNITNHEDNKVEEGIEKEEEYSYDEIAGFIAHLQIDEEGHESSTKKNDDDARVNDAHSDCSSCHDDNDSDHNHNHEGNAGDDLDALFTPLDGTAMYYTTCKMNHSCNPNVIARYTFSCSGGGRKARWGKDFPLVVSCTALRDIDVGEELCISYINSDLGYKERTKLLDNYGFKCSCSKCVEDQDISELRSSYTSNLKNENKAHEDKLFGVEDDLFGYEDDSTEESKNGDDYDDDDTTGSEELIQVKKKLNKMFSNSSQGSIPINAIAPATSFALQLGLQALQDIDSCNTQGVEDLNTSSLKQLLKNIMDALNNQDYVETLENAIRGEECVLDILYINRGWPNAAHREAHGCFSISGAIVHAKNGNFLPAMKMLDRALIFGLPRQKIYFFLQIVELHASNASIVMNNRQIETIPNYREPLLRQLILKHGLSAQIRYPIVELDTEALSCDLFQEIFFKSNEPVVIRGLAKAWPALEKWRRLEFFCQKYGHRVVPIEKGAMTEKSGLKEELMTMKEFLQNFLSPNSSDLVCSLKQSLTQNSIAYLAQHLLFEQIPDLLDDIDASPSLCGKDGPSHINAWIGTGGTRTPLHYDSYDNLFVQVIGSKYVRLYPPKETQNLYVMKQESSTYGKQGNFSSVDCEAENFSLHPKAKHSKYTEAVLFPGDALFIPCRQWHYLRSCSSSASVNFWF